MSETTLPSVRDSDPSTDAAESMVPHAPTDRRRVLDLISRLGSATCDEAELALQLRHQNASARFWELERDGKILKTETRRVTRSGRTAKVYILAPRDGAAE